MTVLRFLAGICLIAALVALVTDATRPRPEQAAFAPTSLGKLWSDTAPRSLAATRNAVSQASSPLIWDALVARVLQLPTFLALGGLGLLFGYLGRRRRRIDVFTN